MKLSNDSYRIVIRTKNSMESYYRDGHGWVKRSAKGREFRATAEQVLNHILPVISGAKPSLAIEVEHLG